MMNKGKKDIKIRKMGLVCGILACIVGIGTAGATTMCMTADTTAIILDPSVGGTSYDSDETEKTWSVTFRYGTVSGIATCNSTAGNWGTAHGEYNNVFTLGTNGVNCWCRMLSPVRSSWIAGLVASTEQYCASICADNCGLNIRSVQEFRRAMYTTAGQ